MFGVLGSQRPVKIYPKLHPSKLKLNFLIGNAEISSSDSGNEREKCDESKKTVATNTSHQMPTHHISNGSSPSHHSSKDADMRSDSSDSCSKEVCRTFLSDFFVGLFCRTFFNKNFFLTFFQCQTFFMSNFFFQTIRS